MRIVISGCDDATYIDEEDWGGEFTPDELKTIRKLSELSHEISSYICEPTIEIEELEE